MRMRRMVGKNESAISPVVGIVLMVSITAMISSVVYVAVDQQSSASYEKAASVRDMFKMDGTARVIFGTPNDTEVPVNEIDPDPSLCLCKYALYEKTTNQYVNSNGYLQNDAIWLTKNSWSGITVKNLQPSTTYKFYVVTWCNCESEQTMSQESVEVTTAPPSIGVD